MSTEIITSLPIEAFTKARDIVHAKIDQAAQLLMECDDLMRDHQLGDLAQALLNSRAKSYLLNVTAGHDFIRDARSGHWQAKCKQNIDAQAWDALMRHSGMLALMDTERRKAWQNSIEAKEVPPLDVKTIMETFKALADVKHEILVDGVVGLFRGLSWDHKTNLPHMFSEKLIIKGLSHDFGGWDFEKCNLLNDLMRVCRVFDGLPELQEDQLMLGELSKHYGYNSKDAVDVLNYANDYFELKVFKNGNCHLLFKNLGIVDKLNCLLHTRYPNALPPVK